MTETTNAISDAQLAELAKDVRERFRHAEDHARNAVSLFDFGVARGLLLGLKMDDRIDSSTLDRMYKRLQRLVPSEILKAIPPEHTADLGKGIVVPASLGTRRAR